MFHVCLQLPTNLLFFRSKFVEDLKESIAEMDEMEQLRIESELEKQQVMSLDLLWLLMPSRSISKIYPLVQ